VTSIAVVPLPRAGLSDAKRRVLEVAAVMFGEDGYHGVSMRHLADALEMQAQSLYAHVPSKQHLLFELCAAGVVEHRSRVMGAILEAGSDPVAQMRALVGAHVLAHLDHPELGRIASRESHHLEPDLLAQVTAMREQTAALFLEIVDRGARLGAFTVAHPRRAMRAIADMGIRLAEQDVAPDERDHIVEDYVTFALSILMTEAPPSVLVTDRRGRRAS
jgi:AcrR family transcriptional regulator